MLGLLERYMTPTLDSALLYSSRVGSDLGRASDWFEELYLIMIALSYHLHMCKRQRHIVLEQKPELCLNMSPVPQYSILKNQ